MKRALLFFFLFAAGGCNDPSNIEIPPNTPILVQHVVTSDQYLNHRFFQLDLPTDLPGRAEGELYIDPNTVMVYQLISEGIPEVGDIPNVAAYLDTTGVFWSTEDCPPNDFQTPAIVGDLWRPVYFEYLVDVDGYIEGIDVGEELPGESVLAVVYEVVEHYFFEAEFRVGDRPGRDEDLRVDLPGEEGLYYRMKLLKAPESMMPLYSFGYVMRNFYDLGRADIDHEYFEIFIERNDGSQFAEQDENSLLYNQVFGLDQEGPPGFPDTPEGLPDIRNSRLFDLYRGILRFPLATPFSAGEAAYQGFAGESSFVWEDTYLSSHQAPELYDPAVMASEYPQYGHFRIRTWFRDD